VTLWKSDISQSEIQVVLCDGATLGEKISIWQCRYQLMLGKLVRSNPGGDETMDNGIGD